MLPRLRAVFIISTIILWMESLTTAFFITALILAVLIAVMLSNILNDPLELSIFLLGAFIFFYNLIKSIRTFKPPTHGDVTKRIEKNSDIKHRPVTAIQDNAINLSNANASLWEKNQTWFKKSLAFIKPTKWQSQLTKRDPYALRFLIIGLLILTIVVAAHDWKDRLTPNATSFIENSKRLGATASLYITPPKYTRIDPIILNETNQAGSRKTLAIPEGSTFNGSIKARFFKPYLITKTKNENNESVKIKTPFTKSNTPNDTNLYTLKHPIKPSNSLSINRFLQKTDTWNYTVLKDMPPALALKSDAAILNDGLIQIPLTLHDDYGVQTITVTMNIDPMIEQPPIGAPITRTRSVNSSPDEPLDILPVFDYTAHPWAGLPVTLTVTAHDHRKQTASLQSPIQITLPERIFEHPLAIELTQYRKKILWEPNSKHYDIARKIEESLSTRDLYQGDLLLFLALRSAASRLYWSKPSEDNAAAVAALIWDIAIALEDGNISLAMRDLRDAQDNLDALMRDPGATQDDIAKAMQDVRQAMQSYLNELARELQKNGAPTLSEDALDNIISPDALNSFLAEMEEALRNGDTEKAMEMMAQLQDMMDQMQPSMMQMPPDMQMMQDGANELQELIEKQETLLEQTKAIIKNAAIPRSFGKAIPLDDTIMNQLGMSDMPPAPSAPAKAIINTQGKRTEQEGLRIILGQLMLDAAEVLDDIPEGMGLAEQEMRQSSAAFKQNDPQTSIPHQQQAIEYLKQAKKQLSQQFKQRMQQMGGMALRSGNTKRDPLGRPYGEGEDGQGFFPGSKVKIPNQAERKRAFEILKELRNKSSDQSRAREELQYFKRLLKQF